MVNLFIQCHTDDQTDAIVKSSRFLAINSPNITVEIHPCFYYIFIPKLQKYDLQIKKRKIICGKNLTQETYTALKLVAQYFSTYVRSCEESIIAEYINPYRHSNSISVNIECINSFIIDSNEAIDMDMIFSLPIINEEISKFKTAIEKQQALWEEVDRKREEESKVFDSIRDQKNDLQKEIFDLQFELSTLEHIAVPKIKALLLEQLSDKIVQSMQLSKIVLDYDLSIAKTLEVDNYETRQKRLKTLQGHLEYYQEQQQKIADLVGTATQEISSKAETNS